MSVRVRYSDELYHHGILGQKWGVRRFQNPDGSLTPEGMKRYGRGKRLARSEKKVLEDLSAKYNYWTEQDIHNAVRLLGVDGNAYKNYESDYSQTVKDNKKIYEKMLKQVNFNDAYTRGKYQGASELAEYASDRVYGSRPKEYLGKHFAQALYMGIFEDGQQGHINAANMSAYKTLSDADVKRLDRNNSKHNDLWKTFTKDLESKCEEKGVPKSCGWRCVSAIDDNVRKNNLTRVQDDIDYLLASEPPSRLSSRDKSLCEEALSICENLTHNVNSWWYLDSAMEKCGLDNKKVGDFTKADWDKVNKELEAREEAYQKEKEGSKKVTFVLK